MAVQGSGQGATSGQGAGGVNWGKLSKGLFLYCRGRGLPPEDAEEIAQEAICQAVNPKKQRDPEKYPTVSFWLQSIANGLIRNRRRNVTRNTERLVQEMPEEPAIEIAGVARAPRRPDARALTSEEARLGVTRVLELLKGDGVAEAVVFMKADGLDKPSEQAKEQKVDINRIYRAREKVAAVTAQVDEEMEEN